MLLRATNDSRATGLRVLFVVGVLAWVCGIDAGTALAQGGAADANGTNSESINIFKLLVQGGFFHDPHPGDVAHGSHLRHRALPRPSPIQGSARRSGGWSGQAGRSARRFRSTQCLQIVPAVSLVRGECRACHVAEDRAASQRSRARRGRGERTRSQPVKHQRPLADPGCRRGPLVGLVGNGLGHDSRLSQYDVADAGREQGGVSCRGDLRGSRYNARWSVRGDPCRDLRPSL